MTSKGHVPPGKLPVVVPTGNLVEIKSHPGFFRYDGERVDVSQVVSRDTPNALSDGT